jgi:hypothetical protein
LKRCLDCPALIATGFRCAEHRRERERTRRPSPTRRGYDAAYQRIRAELLVGCPRCELLLDGCTGTATTLDHQPPLSSMPQGQWAGRLVPACHWCNTSRGNR